MAACVYVCVCVCVCVCVRLPISPPLPHLVVVTDAGGLPAAIVTAGVALVELKPKVWIPSHVEDRHTERTQPWKDRERGRERGRVLVEPLYSIPLN